MTLAKVEAAATVSTTYWHRLADGRVQCDVCPRACKLREGQRGLCFVRRREGGEVVLTTYGRSSGFCVDPIEKKPLNHCQPGTPVLSFGTAGGQTVLHVPLGGAGTRQRVEPPIGSMHAPPRGAAVA